MGGGPRTGFDGSFEVRRVRPGKGRLSVVRQQGESPVVVTTSYEVSAGDEVDLGTLTGTQGPKPKE